MTRQQITMAAATGLQTEAYLYLWTAEPQSAVADRVSLLQGLGISRVWLDCEDISAATPAARLASIHAALDVIEAHGYEVAGIYTGRWWWTAYVANSADFSALPLWDSNYDGVADRTLGFRPYGGWTECAMKQYAGTSSLAGVGGLDLNAY